ncbi:thiolase family protein [Mycolicibacterium elephantis]
MRDVYIVGVGMTPFRRKPETTLRALATGAVAEAVRDANITMAEVDTVYFANAAHGLIHGQEMIRGQVALHESGLTGQAVVNVENACASGSTAAHLACTAVASEAVDVALVVGAEQMSHPDRSRSLAAIGTAVDIGEVETLRTKLHSETGSASSRSLFMDIYADQARRYLDSTAATAQDFAELTVKNRGHAALNPFAQRRDALTVDEVLASRSIAGPLTLPMCSPIGDGAAALVVASRGVAERSPAPLVRVVASCLVSGQTDGASPSAERRAANAAYASAGIGPEDVDVIELHDAAAPAELTILEELGTCPPGEAVHLSRSGATRLGGRIPVNTSGGLVSRGHPLGATGCAQLVELVTQLRGTAGPRQVAGARIGLAENAGGHLGPDPAAVCVTMVQRVGHR